MKGRTYKVKISNVVEINKKTSFRHVYFNMGDILDTMVTEYYELSLTGSRYFACSSVSVEGDYVIFNTDELDNIEIL